MATLLCEVVAYDVDFAEYFAGCTLQGVRPALTLVGIGVDDDAYALRFQFDVDVGIGHDRVAVVVNVARLLAVNVQTLALESLDF